MTGTESQTILVVGGGIAGITAAVEAADAGYEVVLVEQGPALGGRVARLARYFPKLCHPACGLEIHYKRLRDDPAVRILTMTEVTALAGGPGAFTATLSTRPRYVNANCTACGACAGASEMTVPNPFNYGLDTVRAAYLPHPHAFPQRYVVAPQAAAGPEGEKIKAACPHGAVDLEDSEKRFDIAAGAVIWATGWRPYDAARLTSYAYTESADIVTNVEFERLASAGGPTGGRILRPSSGEAPSRVALIQCAGSRDTNHLPYCSAICCLASLKHAALLREQYEGVTVDIYYIDIRAHDRLDAFYERVRRDPQVNFVKSKPGEIVIGEDGHPVLCGEDTVTREIYHRPYDMVVLATGMVPSGGLPAGAAAVLDGYGFAFGEDGSGIYAAGVASGPLDVAASVQSATAAALKAIQAVRAEAAA